MSEALGRTLDFHNHLMPAVDDGAQTPEDSAEGLAQFAAQGVAGFITTPHFDASLTLRPGAAEERLEELDDGWTRLLRVAQAIPSMFVGRGAEVMLDAPLPNLSDPRLHLNGGRFVLIEFPYMTVPPESTRALHALRAPALQPVLAHPERYAGMSVGSTLPEEWRAAGALLQVNGGSLTGRYGKGVRAIAIDLLQRGLVDYVCSDYHTRASPLVNDYRLWLQEHAGAEHAMLLMETNPRRLLEDQLPLPIPPIPRRGGILSRMLPRRR